jgi:carboxypeptidase Taq
MESDFTSSLFGVLHEAGHGLYEQGLPAADFGFPSGNSVSLGIHESQSRLWENHVGRSRAFWEKWYPVAQDNFPQLVGFPLENFLNYLWRAEFSPIRVEADEATYDLHILLRFELERRMMNGSLAVADVPAAWNDGFRELFGFAPPDDHHGCLQDIHWSMGGFGYFATYTLGNINSAQLFAAASKQAPIAAAIEQADYAPLLAWLRSEVHTHGATLDPAETHPPRDGRAACHDRLSRPSQIQIPLNLDCGGHLLDGHHRAGSPSTNPPQIRGEFTHPRRNWHLQKSSSPSTLTPDGKTPAENHSVRQLRAARLFSA